MLDLTDKASLKQILGFYDLSPTKKLGQNFLVNRQVLEDTVIAADLSQKDLVVEIGPGLGTLTRSLSGSAGRVIAIEKDEAILPVFRVLNRDLPNVRIVEQNILAVTPKFYQDEVKDWLASNKAKSVDQDAVTLPYKVVANIPYYITSAIIKNFLDTTARPKMLVLMVQKEVAERITAEPGDMSLLSLSVRFYGVPSIVRIVPKTDFWPAPQVDSAILKIETYDHLPWENVDEKRFFRLLRIGFAEKRKQLKNTLAHGLRLDDDVVVRWLTRSGIDPTRRAETLDIKEWINLYHTYEQEIGRAEE
jgi:16S rRNA (adenine1518-N6/adenine1519-N6)-dimethyltransferase